MRGLLRLIYSTKYSPFAAQIIHTALNNDIQPPGNNFIDNRPDKAGNKPQNFQASPYQ